MRKQPDWKKNNSQTRRPRVKQSKMLLRLRQSASDLKSNNASRMKQDKLRQSKNFSKTAWQKKPDKLS